MMRVVEGPRLVVFGFGLNAMSVGAVLAVGYLSLRYPNAKKAFREPGLYDVVYDVPHWMLGVGVGMCCVGALCVAAGWYSSPTWREGPLPRRWFSTVASALVSGWSMSVLVAVLGRDSAELRSWLVLVAIVPVVTALTALWVWVRADR